MYFSSFAKHSQIPKKIKISRWLRYILIENQNRNVNRM